MRQLSILLGLFCVISTVQGQEQERKLVDRLLSPDTTLDNPAQNKKFSADRRSLNKPANVGTFYFDQKTRPNDFSGTRGFRAGQFHSREYSSAKKANTASGVEIQNAQRKVDQPSARGVRETSDARKTVAIQKHGPERPFLDKGKSQKSLDRHPAPMSIDDVRELLNKN